MKRDLRKATVRWEDCVKRDLRKATAKMGGLCEERSEKDHS